ncbi:MAG TPA: M12 family metallopeptidase [Longimicrobium sp.]|nr:M12 family metallopeptidase [Longimicrobium sp.]
MKHVRILPLLALAVLAAACQDAPFAAEPETPATPPAIDTPASTDVRKGWIYGPGGEPVEVSFVVSEGWAIFEGDINLGRAGEIAKTRDELVRASSGPRYGVFINGSSYRWNAGVVPFVIDAAFGDSARQTIIAAMNHVAGSVGGVSFRQRTSEASWIRFVPHDSLCNSPVGRQGGAQIINLTAGTNGCARTMGVVAHEILHSLGMWHEQSRCDRDSYVTINWGNILPGRESNFDKLCSGNTYVFAYNEGSIMHYRTNAFTSNGQPTIVSKRGLDSQMGQRTAMAQTDISTINYVYQPRSPGNVTVTNSWGNAIVSWNPSPGATHYTIVTVERYERRNFQTGSFYSQEYRSAPVTVSGTSVNGGTYTGQHICTTFESDYESEEYVYEWELRAHFPDGISGAAGRVPAPIGPC